MCGFAICNLRFAIGVLGHRRLPVCVLGMVLAWPAGAQLAGTEAPAPPAALTYSQLVQHSGGSLFRAGMAVAGGAAGSAAVPPSGTPAATRSRLGGMSYISVAAPEPRQLRKHDLITIIVREESTISSDGKTDLKKDSTLDAQLDEFIKFSPRNFAIMGGAQGANPPSIKLGLSRDFQGEGQIDRTDSFTSRISAQVVDVKPNGTVVIQASKFIKHDEEEQYYLLSGVCRGGDVTPDNSIYSWQIANLQITTYRNGAIRDAQKRGLIPKLLDTLNPF
jgi:flagellar L-ring protein precursor FlgH